MSLILSKQEMAPTYRAMCFYRIILLGIVYTWKYSGLLANAARSVNTRNITSALNCAIDVCFAYLLPSTSHPHMIAEMCLITQLSEVGAAVLPVAQSALQKQVCYRIRHPIPARYTTVRLGGAAIMWDVLVDQCGGGSLQRRSVVALPHQLLHTC